MLFNNPYNERFQVYLILEAFFVYGLIFHKSLEVKIIPYYNVTVHEAVPGMSMPKERSSL